MKNNIDLQLHRGKVISIEDPDELGLVQIKLLPEMTDISDSDCPWLPSFKGNSSSNSLQNNPPEEGSLVWVLSDEFFYNRFYLPCEYNISGKFSFSDASSLLSGVSEDTTYKNIQFTLYEDGSLSFHNRNDGAHGFIQSASSYILMRSDGTIEFNGNTNSMVTYLALNTALQAHITKYNADMALILTGATTAIASSGLWTNPLSTIGVTSMDISGAEATTVKTL